MTLPDKEQIFLKKTKLRNLKRKYAKMIQHADLTDESQKLQKDIKALEKEIKSLNS